MAEKQANNQPFKMLGKVLEKYRVRCNETIAEVSGAVEIDERLMQKIEQGVEAPSEDVLMLLLSHFNIDDDQAIKLWELAGYDDTDLTSADPFPTSDMQSNHQSLVIVMPLEPRVLYSNNAIISTDANGVILNFLQTILSSNGSSQQIPIARVGMSHGQAKDLLQTLGRSLRQSNELNKQTKRITAPKNKKTDDI